MGDFRKNLKEKADNLADNLTNRSWNNEIPAILRRQIALTLNQMKRLKSEHDYQFHRLLRLECYIGTDLLQIKQREPRYAMSNLPETEKLKQRLFDIEKQRQTLSLRLEEKTQSLESKLLELIDKHQQLDI